MQEAFGKTAGDGEVGRLGRQGRQTADWVSRGRVGRYGTHV